jgi:hypothetical protein
MSLDASRAIQREPLDDYFSGVALPIGASMGGLYLTFTSTTRQEFLDAALAKHYNRRQRGWVTLLRDFAPPGGTRPYEVMGLELPVAPRRS